MSKESEVKPGDEVISLRRIREINRMAQRYDVTPFELSADELQAISYYAYCWVEEHRGPEDE